MTAKATYREFCSRTAELPIFCTDWWLDASTGQDGWDVALVSRGGEVIAAMPYTTRRKFGVQILGQPPMTQALGPWFRVSEAKYAKQLTEQKDLLTELVDQLPKFGHFEQSWHPDRTNWLPFHWRGFEQTTLYTYVIRDLSDEDRNWGNMLENIRGDIRKARERFGLRIRENPTLDEFVELLRLTYRRQGKPMPHSRNLLGAIDDACQSRSRRRILIAEDKDGNAHAGVYIVWDTECAHYLMGGSNPSLRNSGANSMCLWEAIRFASSVTKAFNFEGSMIEPIERFFRAFGAIQTPYFRIRKSPSRLVRLKIALGARN